MANLIDNTDPMLPSGKVKVPPKPKSRQPILVNGVAITADSVQSEAQNHPASTPVKAFAEAARALVVRELLRQEAVAKGIVAEPETVGEGRKETEEDAAIRELMAQEITVPTANEADCQRYFEVNTKKFRSDTIYEVRHILFSALPTDDLARGDARIAAEVAIANLNDDPSQFAALAKSYSACPSKEQGGSLGQLTKGSTVPEFEKVLFTLKEGQMSPEPVPTPFGFHVIQLDRIISGEELPFEAVKGRIAAWLEASSWSRAVSQYIGILVAKAELEGIDLDAANGPLVQ